jgi:raffinose/stachyose/melibiose transport system substrate-binding protein
MRRLTVVLILFLLLTGCGLSQQSLDGKRVKPLQTLTWVHHFDEDGARKWLDIGITDFKAANPGYSFVLQGVSGGDYVNLLRTRVVADNMPDIYMIDSNDTVKDLIDSGYAMDLSGQPFLNNIEDKYLKGARTTDGKIWALPIPLRSP